MWVLEQKKHKKNKMALGFQLTDFEKQVLRLKFLFREWVKNRQIFRCSAEPIKKTKKIKNIKEIKKVKKSKKMKKFKKFLKDAAVKLCASVAMSFCCFMVK